MTKRDDFLALHVPGDPLLIPNPWDAGSARVLASLGFRALATTSGGFAATLGRRDGSVTRGEAIGHGAAVAAAVDVPVSADLENAFADDPAGVAETVERAVEAGLAGCSVEDWSGSAIYEPGLAEERVAAAVAAAGGRIAITARAENHLHGVDDLSDTIARLQSYAAAGADVLYAPGPTAAADIKAIVSSVDRPVNVLPLAGSPTVAELADLGVARISVGSHFANVALGALVAAGRELLERGTYDFFPVADVGRAAGRAAFR
ncbi:MAG TPA: isocitrate lyase/phosphoenolpyruvate mutase family protein [Mycobacteriales bacterium]|nr:isocitrate lyase/phosphoenolpyruvate mutase family protein [Mycobacteriales bacterium]